MRSATDKVVTIKLINFSEITSGVTIFRIEIFPEFLKLVKRLKRSMRKSMLSAIFNYYYCAQSRVYVNNFQGDFEVRLLRIKMKPLIESKRLDQ